MADALQNHIDGTWLDAQDGARFDVFNPATGEVIATAPDSKPADVDVDAAVATARRPMVRMMTGACLQQPLNCTSPCPR